MVSTLRRNAVQSVAGLVLKLGAGVACDTGAFSCSDDRECVTGGASGVCEPSGYCSFGDSACASGRRYGTHSAPGLANTCVESSAADDGAGGGEPGPQPGDSGAMPASTSTSSSSSQGVSAGGTSASSTDTSSALTSAGTSGASAASTGTGEPTCTSEAEFRTELLGERRGFAAGAGAGALVWPRVAVTTTDDAGPGSLRAALEDDDPAWIVFAPEVQGQTIDLGNTAIAVQSDKVLDGRGEPVALTGAGLRITDGRSNIVVHNLCLHDIDDLGNYGVGLRIENSTDVWIDAVTVERANTNAIAVTTAGRIEPKMFVGLSRSRLDDTDETMMLAATPNDLSAWEDGPIVLTEPDVVFISLWRNYVSGGRIDNPHVRGVTAHLWNNWIAGFGGPGNQGHGLSVSDFPAPLDGVDPVAVWGTVLLLEGNVFDSELSNRGLMALAGSQSVELSRVQSVGSLFVGIASNVLPPSVLGPLPSESYQVLDYNYTVETSDHRTAWRDAAGCMLRPGWETIELCD